MKWCAAGAARPGSEWALGAHFNSPEKNCCACGKRSVARATKPSAQASSSSSKHSSKVAMLRKQRKSSFKKRSRGTLQANHTHMLSEMAAPSSAEVAMPILRAWYEHALPGERALVWSFMNRTAHQAVARYKQAERVVALLDRGRSHGGRRVRKWE